ncbi:MAG TPA: hypothetical protein VGE62_00730, partial [Candidatus Paceibacterota bacterium]
DIGRMFINRVAVSPAPAVVATSTSTSTDAQTSPADAEITPQGTVFSRNRFVDKVIENKDSRALVDENGNILMLYTFVDKNTLVIATSDKALKEIMFRLTTGRIIR